MLLFLVQLSIMFFCLLIFKSQTWNIFVLFYIDCSFCSPQVNYCRAENKNLNIIARCKQFTACTAHFNFFQFFDGNTICIFLLILIRSRTLQLLETQVNLVCPSNKILLCYEIWQLCVKRLIGLNAEFFVTERLSAKTIYTKAETESDATWRKKIKEKNYESVCAF